MEDRYKVISLAKKLKELSERGIGGEKENAISKLNLIMKKHGITFEDIEGGGRKDYEFELKKEIEWGFIRQVLSSIVGRISKYGCKVSEFKYVQKRGYKSYHFENIEPEVFSEFIVKVEMYWEHLQKEIELFKDAYIQANRLYVKPEEGEEPKQTELTREEEERLFKLMNMMNGIDKLNYQKRIG